MDLHPVQDLHEGSGLRDRAVQVQGAEPDGEAAVGGDGVGGPIVVEAEIERREGPLVESFVPAGGVGVAALHEVPCVVEGLPDLVVLGESPGEVVQDVPAVGLLAVGEAVDQGVVFTFPYLEAFEGLPLGGRSEVQEFHLVGVLAHQIQGPPVELVHCIVSLPVGDVVQYLWKFGHGLNQFFMFLIFFRGEHGENILTLTVKTQNHVETRALGIYRVL